MITLWLFVSLSAVGAVDVGWYHLLTVRVWQRPQSRREELAHLGRGVLFIGMLLLLLPGQPRGAFAAALLALFALDLANTIADTMVERDSRADLGGLSRGEYIVHVIGSLLTGAAFALAGWQAIGALGEPTGFTPWPASPLPVLIAASLAAATLVLALEAALHVHARSTWQTGVGV